MTNKFLIILILTTSTIYGSNQRKTLNPWDTSTTALLRLMNGDGNSAQPYPQETPNVTPSWMKKPERVIAEESSEGCEGHLDFLFMTPDNLETITTPPLIPAIKKLNPDDDHKTSEPDTRQRAYVQNIY